MASMTDNELRRCLLLLQEADTCLVNSGEHVLAARLSHILDELEQRISPAGSLSASLQ
jgi:hypothetical protein